MKVTPPMIMKKLLPLTLLLFAPSLLIAASSNASNSFAAARKNRTNDVELSALRASLQAKLNTLHAAGSFPGGTIGFVLPDGRSSSVSTGVADLENKVPLKPTDRMLAGSIGKTYVSTVMLQLVQEGKVNLDTKIERWFASDAWFPRLPNAKDIHSGGDYLRASHRQDRLRRGAKANPKTAKTGANNSIRSPHPK